jgi:hypothetical protein
MVGGQVGEVGLAQHQEPGGEKLAVAIQPSTFNPPASRDNILAAIERQAEHLRDETTYLVHLIPLAERFGPEVYTIAASALSERGIDVAAARLAELAQDFTSAQGTGRYREARIHHAGLFITNCKDKAGSFSAEARGYEPSVVTIRPWHDKDLPTQNDEYEKQALAWQFRELCKDWLRNYVHMAKGLIRRFGEEEVLDILEQVWWDLHYEGGATWREDFEKDIRGAFRETYCRWHCGAPSLTRGVQDVKMEDDRWELLHLYCKQMEVALEMDARKIIIGQCMGDIASTRGWSPRITTQFPNAQLRGDSFCYQIREIVDEADPSEDEWSEDRSEKYGWRSIKKLEEAA